MSKRLLVRATVLTVLLCACGALLAGAAEALRGGAPQSPGAALAERALALIAAGDAQGLAGLHHYPESYSPEEREKDVAAVTKGVAFLLERFGRPEGLRPLHTTVSFFEIAFGGGTLDYWASLSPLPEQDVVYAASFPKLGAGVVKLSIVRVNGGAPDLRAVSFGLPTTSPGAKSTMAALSAAALERMGFPVPPELRQAIADQLEPVTAPPASIE